MASYNSDVRNVLLEILDDKKKQDAMLFQLIQHLSTQTIADSSEKIAESSDQKMIAYPKCEYHIDNHIEVQKPSDSPSSDNRIQSDNLHSGRLSRRYQQILAYSQRPLPRLPQELLLMPVVEGSDISDVCRCHHNLRCHLHFQGEEYLYVNTDKVNRPNQSREMDPLQVLFGFMGEISLPEDVKHIPKDNYIAYVDDIFIREDKELVPCDLDFESVDV